MSVYKKMEKCRSCDEITAKFAVWFNKAAGFDSNLNRFDKKFLTSFVRRKIKWTTTGTWRMSVCVWSRSAQTGERGEK